MLQEVVLSREQLLKTRKFYSWRNNNKVDSIETGRIIIAHLLPLSDVHHVFLMNDDKFYRYYLI